jgi:hypothetical protein
VGCRGRKGQGTTEGYDFPLAGRSEVILSRGTRSQARCRAAQHGIDTSGHGVDFDTVALVLDGARSRSRSS